MKKPRLASKKNEHRLAFEERVKLKRLLLGNNIRAYRERHEHTLESFAAAVGVSHQQLAHIERAESSPSFAVLIALSDFMKRETITLK